MSLDSEQIALSTNTKIRVRPNRKWKLEGNTIAYCVLEGGSSLIGGGGVTCKLRNVIKSGKTKRNEKKTVRKATKRSTKNEMQKKPLELNLSGNPTGRSSSFPEMKCLECVISKLSVKCLEECLQINKLRI